MHCNHCGADLPDEALFCDQCGTRVDAAESAVLPDGESDASKVAGMSEGEFEKAGTEDDLGDAEEDGADDNDEDGGDGSVDGGDDGDAGIDSNDVGELPDSDMGKPDDEAGRFSESSGVIDEEHSFDGRHFAGIPTISSSAPGMTVDLPSPPISPSLDRVIVIGVAVIAVAVAVLILIGAWRFVLSLFVNIF